MPNAEDERIRALSAALPRSRRDSVRDRLERVSADANPVSGLPGFSPQMLRGMLGTVAWGNLREAADTRRIGDDESSRLGALHSVHAEVPKDLLLQGITSSHVDAQRLLVRRSTASGSSGRDVIGRVMVGVKRLPLDLQRETQGSLSELVLKDGVTLPVFGFAVEYENPSLESGTTTDDNVRLARVRLLKPPADIESVRAHIEAVNRDHPDGATTVVGAWHSFDRWQPGNNDRNPYAVNFEDYDFVPSSPEGFVPGEIFQVQGAHAAIRAEILPEKTVYGDQLIAIGISSLEHPADQDPQISFTIPSSLTFAGV